MSEMKKLIEVTGDGKKTQVNLAQNKESEMFFAYCALIDATMKHEETATAFKMAMVVMGDKVSDDLSAVDDEPEETEMRA